MNFTVGSPKLYAWWWGWPIRSGPKAHAMIGLVATAERYGRRAGWCVRFPSRLVGALLRAELDLSDKPQPQIRSLKRKAVLQIALIYTGQAFSFLYFVDWQCFISCTIRHPGSRPLAPYARRVLQCLLHRSAIFLGI